MTRAFGALAAAAALLAAGCATGAGPVALHYGGAPTAGTAQLAHSVSAAQALVRLPEDAGPVLTVVERRSGEVAAQEIAMRADAAAMGENKVRVSVGRLNDGDAVLAPKIAPPLASAVTAEMAAEFPGMSMRVSETVARNAYGPFGYASGTRGRHTCLYAWQFIPKLGEGEESGPLRRILSAPRSAALRIRLCRADAPKERLVKIVEQMTLVLPVSSGVIQPLAGPLGGDALEAVYPSY